MYPPPRPIEPEGMFDGLSPAAILLGAVVDNIATLLTSFGLILALGATDVFAEDEESSGAAFNELLDSPEFLFWSLVLGLSCTVLGAYVGARRAGQLHVRHGGWIAVASALFGLLFVLVPGQQPEQATPLWYEVLGWALLLPSGLLGGVLAGRGS